MLWQVFGDKVVVHSQAYEWLSRLGNGRTALEDEDHSVCHPTRMTNTDGANAHKTIYEGHHFTIHKIFEALEYHTEPVAKF